MSNRIWVDIDQIPSCVKEAFIAIEDERFYKHNGIDIRGIVRAGIRGVQNGFHFSEGASTITQQLIKNNVFDFMSETTMKERIKRKLQEQYLAVKLERDIMTKDEILEAYLNTINLGQNSLGVQVAAQRYFGKEVSELSISEAAVLAGIAKNPTAYNPINYPDNNKERQKLVLDKMLEQGYISEQEYTTALADDVYTRIQNIEEHMEPQIVYSYYVDAQILADISDYKGLENIKQVYRDIDESLELVPTEGTFAVPYMANAAGILYNRDLFEQNGWEIPNNWNELLTLCKNIKEKGILPFYFGFKDTWTCLAPWNAVAVGLTGADTVKRVNRGETNFTKEYAEVSKKYLALLEYGPESPFAYNYNDACTAFARGEAAMYPIGNYAVPQILSVNPDLNIDSFVMPASDTSGGNILNSGIDLQFCITEACENKEAAYEVLDFLLEDENIQAYADAQNAIPCKEGDFKLASMLDGMKEYIEAGKMADFQDHYYPSEMSVDALLQTFLIEKDVDNFLETFDKNWQRYNRDIIRMVKEYEQKNNKE